MCGKRVILSSSFSVIHQLFVPSALLVEGRLCVWWVQRKVSVMEYDLVCMHEQRHGQSVVLEGKLVP